MLKFLSLFNCWLLLSGSISQTPPVAFPDVPTITGNSVGRARIGMSATELRRLYSGCAFTPTYLAKYGFVGGNNEPDAFVVSSGEQKLFVYFLDEEVQKETVKGFIVLNPVYKTALGIHVGSTSGQLKGALPAVTVVSFASALQVASVGTQPSSEYLEYIFFKQEELGKHIVANVPAKITTDSPVVSWILVYPT